MVRFLHLLPSVLATVAVCKTVTYDFNITWVRAAPDGYERPAIGVNGVFPPPTVRASKGDTVIVNVHNALGNESTALHWHGIHQNGTTYMDGASGIGQCPIPPGRSFQYKWLADQPGTYWYHSHHEGQVADGLWGPLIIEDPNPPFKYDDEIILTLSDWYHEQAPYLIENYQDHTGEASDGLPAPTGGALINWGKNAKIHVKPDTTYLVRIICSGSYPGHAWVIEGHNQTAVEMDGTYVRQVNVNDNNLLTRLAPGQRNSFLITTKKDTSQNYVIWDTMDVNMLFINKGIIPPPTTYNTNVTAYLIYNESAPLPPPPVYYSLGNDNFWDDADYVPLDKEPLLEHVDHQIVLSINSANISGISRFTANNETYLTQKVPSAYTALTTGEHNSNADVYGQVNPFIIKHNDVVEIVINNVNGNLHPWHMHGHQFQLVDRPNPGYGLFNGTYRSGYPHASPARRDTIMVQDNSWAVIRFRANNPGVWALHCHIEIHISSGLMATIIEAPDVLAAAKYKIPQDHIDACKAFPMDYEGNAAGNVGANVLNITGSVTDVPQNNWGAIYPPSTSSSIKERDVGSAVLEIDTSSKRGKLERRVPL
jgi:iron transport multicopper oxidase